MLWDNAQNFKIEFFTTITKFEQKKIFCIPPRFFEMRCRAQIMPNLPSKMHWKWPIVKKRKVEEEKSEPIFFFVKSNSVHMKHIKNTFLTPYDLLTSTYLNSWVTSYLVKIDLFEGLRPQRRKNRSQKVEVDPKITNFDTLTPKPK